MLFRVVWRRILGSLEKINGVFDLKNEILSGVVIYNIKLSTVLVHYFRYFLGSAPQEEKQNPYRTYNHSVVHRRSV